MTVLSGKAAWPARHPPATPRRFRWLQSWLRSRNRESGARRGELRLDPRLSVDFLRHVDRCASDVGDALDWCPWTAHEQDDAIAAPGATCAWPTPETSVWGGPPLTGNLFQFPVLVRRSR